MNFTHDTEASLSFVVALVNTAPAASQTGADELSEPAQLSALLDRHDYSGRRDGDEQELHEVRRARDRLRRCWDIGVDQVVEQVNQMLTRARALPQLVRHDHLDWHIHATAPEAPLAERIEVEAALALADVVRGGATGRMRTCAAPGCGGVLFDLSRNGSKRFCSVRCGNRTNVTAYRARRAGTTRR